MTADQQPPAGDSPAANPIGHPRNRLAGPVAISLIIVALALIVAFVLVSSALHRLSLAYQGERSADLERRLQSTAIASDPKEARQYAIRADAYWRQGEIEQAIADYTKAIELDPRYARAYFGRGLIYHNQEKLEEAVAEYSKAIEVDPAFASAYNNRALIYRKRGDTDLAIADFEMYLELTPRVFDREEIEQWINENK